MSATVTALERPGTTNPPRVSFVPPPPATLEQAGLPAALVEQILLKVLYGRGDLLGSELSTAVGLNFSLIESVIEHFKRQRLVESRHSLGIGNVSTQFGLTEAGRTIARQHMETNQYAGVAPVPLSQYVEGVKAQRPVEGWLSHHALAAAYQNMVVSPQMLSQIGPAVAANRSLLMYGQPGNGKTFLAEALSNIQSAPIYLPYAIESQGQIIQIYDPVYHEKIETGTVAISAISAHRSYDGRWFRCKRPFIVTGGELTLDMLDLSYHPSAKVYDAPFHLKANNGIYLIDDFGRQRVSPAEVLNRWIVPMERKIDYLTFHTGGKISVPFDCFLIFSTNLHPDKIGDEAFLRRIHYKMLVRGPDEREYAEIFGRFCLSKRLPCTQEIFGRFLDKRFRRTQKPMRRCQPRDIINHAIDLIQFEKLPYQLTDELLDRAYESCYIEMGSAMA